MTGERMETVRGALRHTIEWHPDALAEVERWERDRARLEAIEAAVTEAATKQQKTLGWIRAHGIVFDGPLGTDPTNWQHIAFSIYSDLCEMDAILRAALGEGEAQRWGSGCPSPQPLVWACPASTTPPPAADRTATWRQRTRSSACPCDGDRGCVCQ